MTYQQIDGARQIRDASIPASKLVDGAVPTGERVTETFTTTSLAENDEWSGVCDLALSFRLLTIETSQAARVRLYVNTAYRDSDAARILGDPPTGDHGLLLEFVTTAGMLAAYLSPLVDGATFTGDATVAALVANLDPVTAAIDVEFLYQATEE